MLTALHVDGFLPLEQDSSAPVYSHVLITMPTRDACRHIRAGTVLFTEMPRVHVSGNL
jgi:hypothetical protein